jgi:DNA-binding CsgD family transcriptional regulator
VIVFLSDPMAMPESVLGRLREAFGLTPTEAKISLSLASGEDLRRTAEQLDISTNTARTHLKHIFIKTETSRQSELVKLLNDAFQFL